MADRISQMQKLTQYFLGYNATRFIALGVETGLFRRGKPFHKRDFRKKKCQICCKMGHFPLLMFWKITLMTAVNVNFSTISTPRGPGR